MKLFQLRITTPSGTVWDEEVACFSCRGVEGDLAVMAGHIPFVTYVKAGRCQILDREGRVCVAETSGGLLTVKKEITHYLPTTFQPKTE